MNSIIYNIYNIITIIAFVILLSISVIEINFNPFSIKLINWVFSTGMLLFLIGMLMMFYHSKREGYKKGYAHCVNDFKDIIGSDFTLKILEESSNRDKEKLEKLKK